MVEHKIARVDDKVCGPCPQNYEGECRAFSVAHSEAESKARLTGYGMECDSPRIKAWRRERFGVKYHV